MSAVPFPGPKRRRTILGLMGVGLMSLAGHAQIYAERDIGTFRIPINDWNMKTTRYKEVWLGANSSYPLPSGVETGEIIGASVVVYKNDQSVVEPFMFLATN